MTAGVCEHCKKRREIKLRERTDPRNFARLTARLCTPCARANGWADVTYERGGYRPLGQSSR